MTSEDAEYFRMRSIAETERAYAATDEVAARRHAELALGYAALQEQAEGRTPSEMPATVLRTTRVIPLEVSIGAGEYEVLDHRTRL